MVDPPRELVVGVVAAAAALAVASVALVLLPSLGRRALRGRVVPAGLVFLAGSVLGTWHMGYLVETVAVGLAVLLAAGLARLRSHALSLALVPIGTWLVLGDEAASLSATGRLLGAVGAGVVAWLVAVDDRAQPDAMALFALSTAGIALCVPDTEVAFVAVGAAAISVLPLLVRVRAPLGVAALGSTGVLVWATAVGGAGRDASIAGAVATVGVLLVEPLLRIVPDLDRRRATGTARVARLGIHALTVAIGSRYIGVSDDVAWASVSAAVLLLLTGAGLVVVDRWTRPVALSRAPGAHPAGDPRGGRGAR